MKKAFFIDVKKREVSEIEINGNLEDYYNKIGCRVITSVSMPNSEDHDVIVDDEGLLKEIADLFSIDDTKEPQFAGNGIIMAVNFETGAWISPKLPLEEVRRRLTFWKVVYTGMETIIFRMTKMP